MFDFDLVKEGNQAYTAKGLKGIKTRVSGATLIKLAFTEIEQKFLENEARFLTHLRGTGFAPKLISLDGARLMVEYLGKSEPVTDETVFRRNCIKLLETLKSHGIRHGDIVAKNVIVKDNRPMLTDFHQSKYEDEPGPDKRPEGDAYHLWKTALELSPDTSRHLRKWLAIRPHLTRGGVLVDVGCAQGDYLLMARAEGICKEYYGIDRNCQDALIDNVTCAELGASIPVGQCDDVLFLSVYAHIAREYDQARADRVLEALMKQADHLFFETQLEGDGPGVHKSDEDVYEMLAAYGEVERLTTIPVAGREPHKRSVWRVTCA